MISVDLNCDMGEYHDEASRQTEAALMPLISSANIACGGHAGDEETIEDTTRLAAEHGVAVGAHPGYPDRENFGRTVLLMSAASFAASIREQISRVIGIADRLSVPVRHVKPHGALYHAMQQNDSIADAIAEVVLSLKRDLVLFGPANSPVLERWRTAGLRVVAEAFADRAYNPDLSLVSRAELGALLNNPELASAQAVSIVLQHTVHAIDGTPVPIQAETLCIHSDTPGSPDIARAVRNALVRAGVLIQPVS